MGKEQIQSVWKRVEKYKYLALVVAVGVALLMIPTGSGPPESATGPPGYVEPSARQPAADFTVEAMERKLQSALAQTEGVGRVTVALTVAGSPAAVYAENQRSRTRSNWLDGATVSHEQDAESQVVMASGASGGTQPVAESTRYPDFIGALIVCDGAGDPTVQLRIAGAVASLTGLTYDKIAIVPMKAYEEEKQ